MMTINPKNFTGPNHLVTINLDDLLVTVFYYERRALGAGLELCKVFTQLITEDKPVSRALEICLQQCEEISELELLNVRTEDKGADFYMRQLKSKFNIN